MVSVTEKYDPKNLTPSQQEWLITQIDQLKEKLAANIVGGAIDHEVEISVPVGLLASLFADVTHMQAVRAEDLAAANQIEALMARLDDPDNIPKVRTLVLHMVERIRDAEERVDG